MATTTPYSIYYPEATDSVAPLNTAFATLATTVNTALTDHVAPLVTTQQTGNYLRWLYTDMIAITGMAIGSTCFLTSMSSNYVFNGTKWILTYQPWYAYTPTAISGISISAKYMVSNNRVHVQAKLTRGGTISATAIVLSLPSNAPSDTLIDTKLVIGNGVYSNGSNTYDLRVMQTSTTTVKLVYPNSNPVKLTTLNPTSSTPPAPGVGDYYVVDFSYPLPPASI